MLLQVRLPGKGLRPLVSPELRRWKAGKKRAQNSHFWPTGSHGSAQRRALVCCRFVRRAQWLLPPLRLASAGCGAPCAKVRLPKWWMNRSQQQSSLAPVAPLREILFLRLCPPRSNSATLTCTTTRSSGPKSLRAAEQTRLRGAVRAAAAAVAWCWPRHRARRTQKYGRHPGRRSSGSWFPRRHRRKRSWRRPRGIRIGGPFGFGAHGLHSSVCHLCGEVGFAMPVNLVVNRCRHVVYVNCHQTPPWTARPRRSAHLPRACPKEANARLHRGSRRPAGADGSGGEWERELKRRQLPIRPNPG